MITVKGIIWKSTGSWMKVQLADGQFIEARLRGKLKMLGIRTTHPVAVGDNVIIDLENEDCVISKILPRQNYIIRKANKAGSEAQIMASNIDMAILVASMVSPTTSFGFIDRFLLCCETFHIPALILLNKADLMKDSDKEESLYRMALYRNLGYLCETVSALNPEHTSLISQILAGKRSMLAGHSGAGKSTWLNLLVPKGSQKTGMVSNAHQKGTHTTTFAEMFKLPDGGEVIDTPGIREFGIIGLEKNEFREYFPEFQKWTPACRFNDCLHTHEPGCAVKKALEDGLIAPERYDSYLSILENQDIMG